jgi:hypothetical protein
MADMGMISAAIASLRLASDMAKTAVSLRDFTKLNETVIELQRVILAAQSDALAAQSDQFTLLQRINDLEKEIARLEEWNTEKTKYELTELRAGVFAYAIKEDARGSEPAHKICPNCYSHGHKSILQNVKVALGRVDKFVCPDCGTTLYLHGGPESGRSISSIGAPLGKR